MSSRAAPGGKQQIASAASPIHNLFKVALTDCSEKFLLGSEIEWCHCSYLKMSFSHSEPENCGIPDILLRNVVPDASGTAGLPT